LPINWSRAALIEISEYDKMQKILLNGSAVIS
jgi:hypothetical protein